MIFNMAVGSGGPSYDDGDTIKYPVESPSGKKIYTEEYISEIGEAINSTLGVSNEYTVDEMSTAILDIPSHYYELTIENNIDMFREVLGWKTTDPDLIAWVQYIGNDHFFIYPAREKITIQAIFNVYGCSRSQGLGLGGMYYHPVSGGQAYMPRVGYENTYPYTVTGVPFGYPVMPGLAWSSRYITFYFNNMGVYGDYLSQFYGLNTATTHPLITAKYGDNRKLSFNNFAQINYTLDQIVKITAGRTQQEYGYTFDEISAAYILKRPSNSTGSINIIFVFEGETTYLRFDANGKLTNGGYYFWYSENLGYTGSSVYSVGTLYSSFFERWVVNDFDLNDETTFENMIYNTRDILDDNGNVAIKSNISVDTIKLWLSRM